MTLWRKTDCPCDQDFVPVTPAEALAVLLPDVDWEALREEAEAYHLYGDTEWLGGEAAFGLVRRLLAVYDGKDR